MPPPTRPLRTKLWMTLMRVILEWPDHSVTYKDRNFPDFSSTQQQFRMWRGQGMLMRGERILCEKTIEPKIEVVPKRRPFVLTSIILAFPETRNEYRDNFNFSFSRVRNTRNGSLHCSYSHRSELRKKVWVDVRFPVVEALGLSHSSDTKVQTSSKLRRSNHS